MTFAVVAAFISTHRMQIIAQAVSATTAYLLLRYRLRRAGARQALEPAVKERLIREYAPQPLVGPLDMPATPAAPALLHNFADHDVFGLGKRFSAELRRAVAEAGLGTCGPRGFYGTLAVHLELEAQLAARYRKAGAVLFANYFTGLQSVCTCFCLAKNTVYFQREAHEAILRGLCASRAATEAFGSLDELEEKLRAPVPDRYVIVERLGKNTGTEADIRRLTALRRKYGFRLIVDEGCAFPFLYDRPGREYADVDIVVGSLAHGYPGSGGFSCGAEDVVDYQRLGAAAYVFSAALPAFLARAALCFLDAPLDRAALRQRVARARRCWPGAVSAPRSPLVLVRCADAEAVRARLAAAGYPAGVCGEYLRLCVGVATPDAAIDAVGALLRAEGVAKAPEKAESSQECE